ncbi:MAG: thiamine pyrophosphate-dependent dehydrogenase E1 component subunit alpha [Candidatus Eisenbacteria bacterium]|uniref:2-oxoisovalerate dehydrogenase subunit alpha n=1 Tax=Eiseniibacteriota bacterium TaxID=2212470 RepID=A0A7Y2E5Z7_UNCEI|nr:thiamine pyrophosphate-dependent dehydrogenase E1 component subunit alpha [Candidatus Eisenbacteria bacterium]
MAKASTSKKAPQKRSTTKKSQARPSDTLTAEQKLELFRWTLMTRKLEERLTNLYRQNKVVGGLYRSLGQEGETVAAAYALHKDDLVGPLIRNLGALLVRGYPARDIAMQYMARGGGPTQGKDLNVHFGDVHTHGVVPPISMLGDVVPVMVGIALAARMKGEKRVALTYIGDGGTSTGAFYEGMNLAAVWKLPVIVIAENNGYAYSTPTNRQMAVDSMVKKADGLGIFGITIDGNDILAVYDAVHEARERGLRDEGPSLIEVMTYRRKGHAEHDMQKYVPKGEIESWEKNDPIDRYIAELVKTGVATKEQLEAITQEVTTEIESEMEIALASPPPNPSITLESVYFDPPLAEDHLAPYRETS